MAEDLRICTVKYADDLERRFCFEVVTPMRSCMLQADSDALRKKWVTYLEAGIARALRISASNKVSYISAVGIWCVVTNEMREELYHQLHDVIIVIFSFSLVTRSSQGIC